MICKHVICLDEVVLGMKYNINSRMFTIGGNFRFRDFMEIILENGFGIVVLSKGFKQVQANKIRFDFKMEKDVYNKGIEYLRKNGYVLELTKRLDDLFR